MVQINGVASAECPVSLTDGWLFQMLLDFSEAARFGGGLMYGPDLSEWPADIFDAFSLLYYEDNRIQMAKMDADSARVTLN